MLATRVQTGTFRSPFTAFLYERGWRQQFKRAGFPGIDKEYEEVREWFAPSATNGVVVDMSCGSGLMTRRLLKSGDYRRVLALDYSEAMLRETARRIREESVPTETLTLCRADVRAISAQPYTLSAHPHTLRHTRSAIYTLRHTRSAIYTLHHICAQP